MSQPRNIAFGFLWTLGVVLYWHTLPFPFVFDDNIYLVGNPFVKDAGSFAFFHDFAAFATASKRMGLDPDLSTNFILRPVTYFTFYLSYAIGGMKPAGFRVVNILIHCTNAGLVFLILSHLLGASPKAKSLPAASACFIALTSALVFLVHPLQIESVTYIIQRFTSLGTLFYLITIWTFMRSYSIADGFTSGLLRLCSVTALVLGMLSKEEVFTAPFMIVILDCLVMGTHLKVACKRALPYFCCLPIIPVLVILIARAQNNGSASLSGSLSVANPGVHTHYQYYYALSQPGVILCYLRKLFVPYGLNIDPDVPLSTSIFDAGVLPPAITIAGVLATACFYWRKQKDDVRFSLLFCSVIWFFLTLAVSSSIAPLPDLMAEHRSYLASIGAISALACAIDLLRTRLASREHLRYLMPAFVIVWVSVLCAATIFRNNVWSSKVSIWRDAAAKSPNKFRPWLNLGLAYTSENPREAVACFQKAIQLCPDSVDGYLDLAATNLALGNYRQASETLQTIIPHAPKDYRLHFDLGLSYYSLGDLQGGIQAFKKVIEINPGYRPAYIWLGVSYARLMQYGKALEYYHVAELLQPNDPQLRQTIIQLQALAAHSNSRM